MKPCLECGAPSQGPRCEAHTRRRDRNLARGKLDCIYLRDGGICQLGGHPVPRTDATLHHVIRHVAGGSDDDSNLVLACRPHNSAAG